MPLVMNLTLGGTGLNGSLPDWGTGGSMQQLQIMNFDQLDLSGSRRYSSLACSCPKPFKLPAKVQLSSFQCVHEFLAACYAPTETRKCKPHVKQVPCRVEVDLTPTFESHADKNHLSAPHMRLMWQQQNSVILVNIYGYRHSTCQLVCAASISQASRYVWIFTDRSVSQSHYAHDCH